MKISLQLLILLFLFIALLVLSILLAVSPTYNRTWSAFILSIISYEINVVLFTGAAVFAWQAGKKMAGSMGKALHWMSTGLLLNALAQFQNAVFETFGLWESAWVLAGMYSLPFIISAVILLGGSVLLLKAVRQIAK